MYEKNILQRVKKILHVRQGLIERTSNRNLKNVVVLFF
jgi:hypothetical protein